MNKVAWKDIVDNCVQTAYMSYSMSEDDRSTPKEFIDYILDSVINVTYDCTDYETADSLECAVTEPDIPKSIVRGPVHRRFYTEKTLSSRFENMLVYISDDSNSTGMAAGSLARIKPSIGNNKVRDLYVLESTGEELNMSEYLSKFGFSKNACRIKFLVNPKVSVWMLKVTHFDILRSPLDIKMFTGGNGDYSYKSCNRQD